MAGPKRLARRLGHPSPVVVFTSHGACAPANFFGKIDLKDRVRMIRDTANRADPIGR